MVIWLTRLEKIEQHIIHIRWRLGLDLMPSLEPAIHLRLTKHPSEKAVTVTSLATKYHAPGFTSSLQSYLQQFTPPRASPNYATFHTTINNLGNLHLTFPVWHRIRITNHSIQDVEGISDRRDAIHAAPQRKNAKTKAVLGERFDTALIDENGTAEVAGITGMS